MHAVSRVQVRLEETDSLIMAYIEGKMIFTGRYEIATDNT